MKLLLLSIAGLFLVSCNADVFLDSESPRPDEVVPFSTTWQGQLEYAKNNNVTARSSANGIYFVRHTYNGKINTKGQISELLK